MPAVEPMNNITYISFDSPAKGEKSTAINEIIEAHHQAAAWTRDDGSDGDVQRKEDDKLSDWQEKYLDKLGQDIADIKASSRASEERVSQMVSQMLGELRDRDNQRHAETLDLRKETSGLIESVHKDIHGLNDKIAENLKWSIGILVSSVIGVAAIIVTILVAK